MVKRIFAHRLFAPTLALAGLGWGIGLVGFLLIGPGLGPWADTLLRACFGWNAETHHYRLDGLVLALLEPPLFVGVVGVFYTDELRAFLRSRGGRAVGLAAAGLFLTLTGYLLATGEVSASGTPPSPMAVVAPIRTGVAAPAFSLVDHRGQRVTRESFQGRPVVLTFVYANCHAACPLLIERLRRLEAGGVGDMAFVAVTLDPERDTPAALAEHAARWDLGPRWHLLTGAPRDVRTLIARYGVQWAPLPDGEIAHENVVVLLDRVGRVAFTYRGLAYPEDRIARDLARLVSERG